MQASWITAVIAFSEATPGYLLAVSEHQRCIGAGDSLVRGRSVASATKPSIKSASSISSWVIVRSRRTEQPAGLRLTARGSTQPAIGITPWGTPNLPAHAPNGNAELWCSTISIATRSSRTRRRMLHSPATSTPARSASVSGALPERNPRYLHSSSSVQ